MSNFAAFSKITNTLFFSKIKKDVAKLSSAAVMIGALRVKEGHKHRPRAAAKAKHIKNRFCCVALSCSAMGLSAVVFLDQTHYF